MGRTLTETKYVCYKGVMMLTALLLSLVVISRAKEFFASWNVFVLIAVYLVIAVMGIMLSMHSADNKLSFAAFLLVVVPAGLVLSLALKKWCPGIGKHLALMAIITVVALMAISLKKPKWLSDTGEVLFGTIFVVVVLELAISGLHWYSPKLIEIVLALGLCCYISCNWVKSQKYELTTDAVVGSCVELYSDPIDRLLELIHKSS